jgi:hypothetical protein
VVLHVKAGGILKIPTKNCALPPRDGTAVVKKRYGASVYQREYNYSDIFFDIYFLTDDSQLFFFKLHSIYFFIRSYKESSSEYS